MPLWNSPVLVGLRIPQALRSMLSFNANTPQAYKTYEVPGDTTGDDGVTDLAVPIFMTSAGSLPEGGWTQGTVESFASFPADPTWVQEPRDGQRFRDHTVMLLNPKLARTDGVPDPWVAQDGVTPVWASYQPVAVRKLVLTEDTTVAINVHQLVDIESGVLGVIVGPNGRELKWFGKWGFTPTDTTATLGAGVYMVLAGVTNAAAAGQSHLREFTGTLTISFSYPPPMLTLVTTRTGVVYNGMESTSRSGYPGHAYRFVAPFTGSFTFWLNSTAFDAYMAVHSDAGVLLAQDDDSGGSGNSRIADLQLLAGETYYVSASAYSRQGTYTVGVDLPTKGAESLASITGYRSTTIAGTPDEAAYVDGPFGTNKLCAPAGGSLGGDGYFYVLENAGIRRISQDGTATTYLSNPEGYRNGPLATARITAYGNDLLVAPNGDIYFTDQTPSVRKIHDGVVSTFAGPNYTLSPTQGGEMLLRTDLDTGAEDVIPLGSDDVTQVVDGTGTEARFLDPQGLMFDAEGNLWVGDGPCIRKVTPAGVVTTPYGLAWPSGLLNVAYGSDGGRNECALATPTEPPSVVAEPETPVGYNPNARGVLGTVQYAYALTDELGNETAISPWSAPVAVTVTNPGAGSYTVVPLRVTVPGNFEDPTTYKPRMLYAKATVGGQDLCLRAIPLPPSTLGRIYDYFEHPWDVYGPVTTVGPQITALLGAPRGGARFKRVLGLCPGPDNTMFAVDDGGARVVQIAMSTGAVTTLVEGTGIWVDNPEMGRWPFPAPGKTEMPVFDPLNSAPGWVSSGATGNLLGAGVRVAHARVYPGGVESAPSAVNPGLTTYSGGAVMDIQVDRPSSTATGWNTSAPEIGWRVYYQCFGPDDVVPTWKASPIIPFTEWSYTLGSPSERVLPNGLPASPHGQASVEPIGVCWDALRKQLLITTYTNNIRLFNPKTSELGWMHGSRGHTNLDAFNGRGDGVLYSCILQPWYPRPGWDPGSFIVSGWEDQCVRRLDYGTWTLPQTVAQAGPEPLPVGGVVEGVFIHGEDVRTYTFTVPAGVDVLLKLTLLDAIYPSMVLRQLPSGDPLSYTAHSYERLGLSTDTATQVFTVPQPGDYAVDIKAVTAGWDANKVYMLGRFKLQVTLAPVQ